ncbi:MAG: hypothetical protein J5J06_15145 [Phycisphaerae bacterium]|nr:hypothetical protein [Phycisphaerae bacterium]
MIPVVREVGRIIERNGGTFAIETTRSGGHATELAATLQRQSDGILVVGGDGTACEVINGLNGCASPLLLLRTGTENLLAHELMMPAEPNDVAMTLLFGEPFPVDIGTMNERRFLAVAGVGFDAECVVRMSRIRTGHITREDYFWPIWRTFWGHRFPELSVEVDGKPVFRGRGIALVGVIRTYAAGLDILSRARFDDGLLDVCVMPCTGRLELLGHAARASLRRHIGRGGVIYRQGRRVRVASPDSDVPVQVDGDYAGTLPAVFESVPRAACFLRLGVRREGGNL